MTSKIIMNRLKTIFFALVLFYLILLIPECQPDKIDVADRSMFIWNKDSLWHLLEDNFVKAKEIGCEKLKIQIWEKLIDLSNTLNIVEKSELNPDNKIFDSLLNTMFQIAPLIGACTDSSESYIELIARMRQIIKVKSKQWDPDKPPTRNTLYKLIYGGRAALEEIILQSEKNDKPLLTYENDERSATPYTKFLGVKIHSGDILLSRGGAPTSALISRGSDYPGNFSHVALVHIDPITNVTSIIEAHIEVGVAIASLEDYMNDKKLRVMILRLRSDLPELISDPMLPQKAATASLKRA